MTNYYKYKIDSGIDTFSQFDAGVNFKFETTTLSSDVNFKKDDLIIGFKAPTSYYVLEVVDYQLNELSLRKKIEIESNFQLHFKNNKSINQIAENEYDSLLGEILKDYFKQNGSLNNTIMDNLDLGNLKQEFVEWFIEKDGVNHHYFSGQFSSSRERLLKELEKTEDVYEQDFGSKIFEIHDGDLNSFIDNLEQNLSKNNGLFYDYSSGKSNHRPRAIVGNNNYIKFLKEKLDGVKETSSISTSIELVSNQIDFDIKIFQGNCNDSGLVYTDKLITRFVSSLLTKPFVILTGLSGSGKTKLAQAFVQWICQEESQYRIIPVGADWTNREPLLGYPNALKPEEYVKPDSGVIDLILQAKSNPELPHFLILDEMNLSHVERYFADFLSVMESNEEIPLYAEGTVENGVPSKLKIPENLFIIGTVNIDETTNMFSPKVLDRANTIEFRINNEEMNRFLSSSKELNMRALYIKDKVGLGATMAKNFIKLSGDKSFATEDRENINKTLNKFFDELQKTGAEFGYRSATEILRLINQLGVLNKELTTTEKIDIAIMQKLLPKLHGSRRKLSLILETLGGFCVKDSEAVKNKFRKEDYDFSLVEVLFPLSLEKISRMYKGAIDNGFTSFAEA